MKDLIRQSWTKWIVLAAICASLWGAFFLATDAFIPIIDVSTLEPDRRNFGRIIHLPEDLLAVKPRSWKQLEKPGKAKDASLVYYFLVGLQKFGEGFASWVIFPGIVVGFAGFSLDAGYKWLRKRRTEKVPES